MWPERQYEVYDMNDLYFYAKQESEHLNQITRGEISAVEAYQLVLSKFESDIDAQKLRVIMLEHQRAAQHWQHKVSDEGIVPEDSPRTWGQVVKAVIGAVQIFGKRAALQALKEGEEYGLKEYKNLLKDKNVQEHHKDYVRRVLIPQQTSHILLLKALLRWQREKSRE